MRATRLAAPCPDGPAARRPVRDAALDDVADPTPASDSVESAELVRRIAGALASYPDDVRLAVELFVVERLSAADVARAVGWPNEKAVYNRVRRTLAALRAAFERQGIGPRDLT